MSLLSSVMIRANFINDITEVSENTNQLQEKLNTIQTALSNHFSNYSNISPESINAYFNSESNPIQPSGASLQLLSRQDSQPASVVMSSAPITQGTVGNSMMNEITMTSKDLLNPPVENTSVALGEQPPSVSLSAPSGNPVENNISNSVCNPDSL